MKRLGLNSTWMALAPAQREALDAWLFVDRLVYAEILTRVKAEFGLDASRTSLGRYYQRRARERQVDELADAQGMVEALADTKVETDDLREAVLKLVAKSALRVASERPQDVADLDSLARILLVGEQNELRRQRLELQARQYDDASGNSARSRMAELFSELGIGASSEEEASAIAQEAMSGEVDEAAEPESDLSSEKESNK